MVVGLRGQSGSLVLTHVGEGPKREVIHVPTHHHNMEVPSVVVMQKIYRNVETFHVQVSVWQNKLGLLSQ